MMMIMFFFVIVATRIVTDTKHARELRTMNIQDHFIIIANKNNNYKGFIANL